MPVLSTEKIAPAPNEPPDVVLAELTAEFNADTTDVMLDDAAKFADTEVPLIVNRAVVEAVLVVTGKALVAVPVVESWVDSAWLASDFA
ncbi:hypothetical protein MKK69_22220 [Methylobacterium sp. J-026]|nr:hypothetical protein [Methylobacterium sp. J-026]